jgi:hypothetical protein
MSFHIRIAMQHKPGNELVGLHGRFELLKRLGTTIESAQYFNGRIGNLVEYLTLNGHRDSISVDSLWEVVIGMGSIWPPTRTTIGGISLGDVWPSKAKSLIGQKLGKEATEDQGLVCFHKLSQWLTYSLVEVNDSH